MQPNKLFYPSGALYADINDKERRYFYEDGKLKTFEPYQNGRLHGEVSLYWATGRLKRRCHFQNGVRVGADQIWREDGTEDV